MKEFLKKFIKSFAFTIAILTLFLFLVAGFYVNFINKKQSLEACSDTTVTECFAKDDNSYACNIIVKPSCEFEELEIHIP